MWNHTGCRFFFVSVTLFIYTSNFQSTESAVANLKSLYCEISVQVGEERDWPATVASCVCAGGLLGAVGNCCG